MRFVFIPLLLCFFSRAYAGAGDTLSRAEIYNFSVGDTFDYMEHDTGNAGTFGPYHYNSVSYSRYVVSNIYWSTDSTAKTIIYLEIYGSPIMNDSLVLNDISGFEVIIDTVYWISLSGSTNYYQINSPPFFNQPTNYTYYFGDGGGYVGNLFAQNFGEVLVSTYSNLQGAINIDTIALIYYSGSHGTFGTPYTSFPTAVKDIPITTRKINVYPTVSTGIFTIESDETQLPSNLFIYDLQGKLLEQYTLRRNKMEIDIGELARGMYIWKSISANAINQAGRVVIQ